MPRRISVKGSSGSGKSTVAAELASRLGLTYIELDELHHGPNWSAPTDEEFRYIVREAMEQAPDGWVIDGNYDSKLGRLVADEADTILWLDLPLSVKGPRTWRRTKHRIRNRIELWNGNRETWRGAFVFLAWELGCHFRHRRTWPHRFEGDERLVRLRTEDEVRRWLETMPEE